MDNTDPCVRKTTSPITITGKKRSLEIDQEEVSSSTKILKTLLESEKQIENKSENIEIANVELFNLIEDLQVSEPETIPANDDEKVCTKSEDSVPEVEGQTITISDEEESPKQIGDKPKENKSDNQKVFKSREFIEDSSSSSSESDSEADKVKIPKKESILIHPQPLKKTIPKTNLVQCNYILIKGSRKGERCSARQRAPFCSQHDKDRKENTNSKNNLIQQLEDARRENQRLNQEIIKYKFQNKDINTKETPKEVEELRKHISYLRKLINNLRESKRSQDKTLEDVKIAKAILENKYKDLEQKVTEMETKKSSKSKKIKKIQRVKLSKLNQKKIYKLVKYCSTPRFEAKEGLFQCEDGLFKVDLPKKFDRKDEAENWSLTYSDEDKRFQWNKIS